MNMERDDEKLRELFQALKTSDIRSAPRFESMFRSNPTPLAASPWLLPAAAAVLLLIAIGAVVSLSLPRPSLPLRPAAAKSPLATKASMASTLDDWHAPTDTLLELPETGWWATTPSFDAEVSDITASRLLEAPKLGETQTEEDAV